jgi:predicted ATPase
VVLTGGPGAGKTAVLEVVRRQFCDHVLVLPESATIVFGGGFPRLADDRARRRAQLAIMHVQDQMERLELELRRAALVLCDRGIPDGLAYWPGDEPSFWDAVGRTKVDVVARYDAVIHLRTPTAQNGYDHSNPVRVETAEQAARIDERIAEAWEGHPRRHFVPSTAVFLDKVGTTLALLETLVPACCGPRRAGAVRAHP